MIYDELKGTPMKGLPNCLVWHNKPPQEEVPATSRYVSTWAQICPNSVEILFNCQNAPLCAYPSRPSCPPRTILFLLISAIVLSIATIIDAVFELESRNFGDFNAGFNVFNLENSGPLSSQTQTPHSTAPPNDTVFYFNPTGAGLREFNVYGCVFDVVLNEYEFNNDLKNY